MPTDWSAHLGPTNPAAYPRRNDPADPRIADIIDLAPDAGARLHPGDAAIIGFPQDEGVRRNLGRPGAAAGPAKIREFLGRLVAPRDFDPAQTQPPLTRALRDLGDINCDADLEASQHRLGEVVAGVLAAGAFPIILGGGHETAFGHFLGYALAGRPTGIVNIDTHLDVRPLRENRGHSGSPFREAIEHPTRTLVDAGYLCISTQEQADAATAFDYVRNRGHIWIPFADVAAYFSAPAGSRPAELPALPRYFQNLGKKGVRGVVLTIDLDSVRQSDAPGVSAPQPIGLTAEQLIAIVQQIAARGVSSIDIAELNPKFDRDDQTARLAALVVWSLLGRQSRG